MHELRRFLDDFVEQGLISEVLEVVKSGKEATVFRCRAPQWARAPFLAGKVYRPLEARNFRSDARYRRGRTVGRGRVKRAFDLQKETGIAVGFRLWVEEEYETLHRAHAAGADVPRPVGCTGHAVLMEWIGDAQAAAPPLHKVRLLAAEAAPLLQRVLRNVETLLACDRVHGDLSPFNILYWHGGVTLIDMPQAIDACHNPEALALLHRDVQNVCRYFEDCGLRTEPAGFANALWSRFRRGEL